MAGSTEAILHLVHPSPSKWSLFSDTTSSILGIPSVPYRDWIAALRKTWVESSDSDKAMTNIPALHLVDFLAEYTEAANLSVERATIVSRSSRDARRLDEEDVKLWLAYWKSRGFLKSDASAPAA